MWTSAAAAPAPMANGACRSTATPPRGRRNSRGGRRVLDHLPRTGLLDADTPFQRLARIEAATGHRSLWAKRDDVAALGLGGNKLRSLEHWLGEAGQRGCDMLVVAGAPESNQCRLTAAAAARLGRACLILHGGDRKSTRLNSSH